MEIIRKVTLVENEKIIIKQCEKGSIILSYDNARITFNKGAFLNFLITVEDWCIKNSDIIKSELIIKSCRFSFRIKPMDIPIFIKTLREASYEVIPILAFYRELNSKDQLFSL